MAFWLLKTLPLLSKTVKVFAQVTHLSDLFKNITAQGKTIGMFTLGDWMRLKIGNEKIVTRRKTLLTVPNTLFVRLVDEDKYHLDIMTMKSKITEFSKVITPGSETEVVVKTVEKPTTNTEVIKDKESHLDAALIIEGQEDAPKLKEKIVIKDSNNQVEEKVLPHEKKLKFEKDEEGYYLIDRDPSTFGVILNYLRTKKLLLKTHDPELVLIEAEYYQVAPLIAELKHEIENRRRDNERTTILDAEKKSKGHGPWFVISKEWAKKWNAFVYKQGNAPPAIDNHCLFESDKVTLKQGLQLNKDYIAVDVFVWVALFDIYRGGPVISRANKEIYESEDTLSSLWSVYNENECDHINNSENNK